MSEHKKLVDTLRKQIKNQSLLTYPPELIGKQKNPIKYLCINTNDLMLYLDDAIPLEHPLIDVNTFYICDLSMILEIEYNSLIFQIDGVSFKSTETTSKIMNRYFNIHVPYKVIQHLGKIIGIIQKCPYVLGDIQFAPDIGITKNNPNWIGIHNVLNYEITNEQCHLGITNHHSLHLNLSKKSISKIFENTFKLYHAQNKFSDEWKKIFIREIKPTNPENIIKRMYDENLAKEKIPSPLTWHTKLVYSLSHDLLNDILEEGDPYRDILLEVFSEIQEDLI
jgi:competence transcription factor ComK